MRSTTTRFLTFTLPLLLVALLFPEAVFAQLPFFKNTKKDKERKEIASRLFIEGERHMMLEDYEKAYFYFDKAHKLAPEEGAVNFKMAEILARANQNEKALEYGKQAIEADPENKYYHLLLAEVYSKQNQPEKAAEIIQSLIESSDDNKQYILELASLYLTTQQFDKALVALNKAEELYGVQEQLSAQKQRIYLKQNNLDAAIREGEKLIEANPGNSRYVLALVEVLFNNNRTDQALQVVQASLDEYPNQPDLHLAAYTLLKAKGEIQAAQAHLFTGFDNPDLEGQVKAQTFTDILQKDLKTVERESLLDSLETLMEVRNPKDAAVYIAIGDRALQNQQMEAALKNFRKSVDLSPQDARALQTTISLMFEQAEPFSEIEQYTIIATDEFPEKPELWFFDGTVKLALKKYEEAATSLNKSLELNKGMNEQLDLMVLGQLGDTYHSMGKEEEAYEAYDKVLAISPNDEHVLNNYAYFLSLEKKELGKAYDMSSKLVKLFPDNATYLDTHAWVLFQKKDYEGAEKFLKKAIELEEKPSGVMLEHYGDILYHLGNKQDAVKYWVKASGEEEVSKLLDKKITDKKYYE